MASLVHQSSAESVSSQLNLFSVPPTQTSLEDEFYTKYRPVSVLTSEGPIEFSTAAESTNYTILQTCFSMLELLSPLRLELILQQTPLSHQNATFKTLFGLSVICI